MEDDMVFAYTTAFNSVLKKFIKFACEKSIALKSNRLKERISLLINEAPLAVMEKSGPYILKYADNIKARDEKFYMTASFDEHFADDEPDLRKNIIALINKMRNIYKKCNIKEKDYLNDLADDMLIAYCSYLHHQRLKMQKK